MKFENGWSEKQLRHCIRFSEVFPKRIVSTLSRQFENTPIGLILCAGKNEELIELMQLEQGNDRVVDYFTVLPSQKLLQDKLHQAIIIAKSKMSSQWTRTLSVYTSIAKRLIANQLGYVSC